MVANLIKFRISRLEGDLGLCRWALNVISVLIRETEEETQTYREEGV